MRRQARQGRRVSQRGLDAGERRRRTLLSSSQNSNPPAARRRTWRGAHPTHPTRRPPHFGGRAPDCAHARTASKHAHTHGVLLRFFVVGEVRVGVECVRALSPMGDTPTPRPGAVGRSPPPTFHPGSGGAMPAWQGWHHRRGWAPPSHPSSHPFCRAPFRTRTRRLLPIPAARPVGKKKKWPAPTPSAARAACPPGCGRR